MTNRYDPTMIMRRVEAAVMGAQINATNQGGNTATVLTDLLLAMALVSARSGVPIECVLMEEQIDNAKATVAAFWPAQQVN